MNVCLWASLDIIMGCLPTPSGIYKRDLRIKTPHNSPYMYQASRNYKELVTYV
jgi:hypothetical protein